MDIKELIEWVAQKIYEAHHSLTLWNDLHEHNKTGWRREAKHLLSHPDLALLVRHPTYVGYWSDVIFLRDAIKEVQDD